MHNPVHFWEYQGRIRTIEHDKDTLFSHVSYRVDGSRVVDDDRVPDSGNGGQQRFEALTRVDEDDTMREEHFAFDEELQVRHVGVIHVLDV